MSNPVFIKDGIVIDVTKQLPLYPAREPPVLDNDPANFEARMRQDAIDAAREADKASTPKVKKGTK